MRGGEYGERKREDGKERGKERENEKRQRRREHDVIRKRKYRFRVLALSYACMATKSVTDTPRGHR